MSGRTLIAVALAAWALGCGSTEPQRRGDDGGASSASPGADTEAGSGRKVSASATFAVTDIDGRRFALADHLGRDVVLLSFWATFCEPCKTEMPYLQRMHERLAGQGLAVLSVSLDGPETWAEVAPYIKSNDYTFPVAIDQDSTIAVAWNPRAAAPFTVLIGRDGRIARTIEGFQLSEAARLEAEVERLLAQDK
ncbi:MAG: TlpA disulfide reductase family protein [Myxococcota bacterium]